MANDDVHYEGETKNDLYHGHGTLSWNEGSYTGEFKNGNYHGHGTLSSEDTYTYTGEFIDDQQHGTDSLTLRNCPWFLGKSTLSLL